jgi:hypothetical protein
MAGIPSNTFPYISNRPEIPAVGGPALPTNYTQQFAGTIDGLWPEATIDGPDRDKVNIDNLAVLTFNLATEKTSVLFPRQQS